MKITKTQLKELVREEILKAQNTNLNEVKLNLGRWPGYSLPGTDIEEYEYVKDAPYYTLIGVLRLSNEISDFLKTQQLGIDPHWPLSNKDASNEIVEKSLKEIIKLYNNMAAVKNQFGKSMEQLDKDVKSFIKKNKIGK